MKGKDVLVRDLERAINDRLVNIAGFKYDDSSYHQVCHAAIIEVMKKFDIHELRMSPWRICTDCTEGGLSMVMKEVAIIDIDLTKDKRYKYGGGRGTINCAKVNFKPEILDMTLDQARRHLLREYRDECIARLQSQRAELQARLNEIVEQLTDLAVMEF